MADTDTGIVFFLLSSFCCFTFALSRSLLLSNSDTTTVLDVSASLQRTMQAISVDQSAVLKPKRQGRISSSSPAFDLHSRFSIHRGSHNDYKSLSLAWLQRDSVRIRSLQTRLDLAVTGSNHSDLRPIEAELAAADKMETPVFSGIGQGSGEYFTRVGIGRPAKEVYMVLDTGSDVNWMQCAPCADCYQQSDPIFEPASSSSYSPLRCDTPQCRSLEVSECRNGSCLYQVSYGDGSYTVGDLVTETITFGKSEEVNEIAIGCGHNNEGLFVGAAGLIGLGGGSLSFPSQINASSFSYCLVDRDSDSYSTLEFDSDIPPPPAVTAPLLRNPKLDTFYYVDMTGLTVAGADISIPPWIFQLESNGSGGVIVDSGTAVTRLQREAYEALRDEFVKGTSHLPRASAVALFDTCYDLSSTESVEVPKVGFRFSNGKVLELPAKNYLIAVDSTGTFCFAFAPSSSSVSIIGNVQQQGTRVTFHLADFLVGFSPSQC